ncbi:hypothetical protein [Luteimonas sp. FCS-9]|uniref:hypothetical protein n=1 Tax=Luteimonas sp. FCS-9 TaxID=1547516 RepID=UPI00069A15B2|nr:hypothetical protein [Luteimonas sp. FCS-9]
MAVTRAKATSLLNKTEMGLYDASRANAVRGHSDAQLAKLVTRARTARDRARDLEKRQRLASRTASGSKSGRSGQANARTGEKAELLSDILGRFETRQKDSAKAARAAGATTRKVAKKAAKPASTSRTAATARTPAAKSGSAAAKTAGRRIAKAGAAAKTATTTKAAKTAKTAKAAKTGAKQAPARRAAAATTDGGKRARTMPAPSPAPRKPAGAGKDAAASAVRKPRRAARISPEQALDNTRQLPEQRTAEARTPKPWEGIDGDGAAPATAGFQSPQARAKALELHAAESRQASINGSSSTRDRKNQGKRDRRSAPD